MHGDCGIFPISAGGIGPSPVRRESGHPRAPSVTRKFRARVAFMQRSGGGKRVVRTVLTSLTAPHRLCRRGAPLSPNFTKSGSFTRLVWSNLAAQAAEQIGLSAALLLAVLIFSAGPGAVGALQAAQTLPFLLVAIPLGVLADRMSRPRLMAAAESLRVVSFALVLVLFATGALTLPLLALLGFIGACGTVAYSVSAPALVPGVVPATALSAANARIEVARTSALA